MIVSPSRAVAGALTTTIAVSVPVFLVGGLAVQIGDELGFSPAGLGLAVSAYFGASALASVPAGALVERYGAAPVSRAGIALASASLLGVAVFANALWSLIAILALGAAANAMGQLASNTSLSRHVPARRQALSFGVKQAAIPISTLLSGASVPIVALTIGWRWAFVLAAALALAALLLVPSDSPPASASTARPAKRATGALIVVGLGATLAAGAANALGTFLVDSAVARGIAPGPAGLALTLGSAVCVAARILGGWLADRRPDNQVGVIAGLLVCGAAGLALLAVPGTVPLIAGVVLGFGLGWCWPGLMNFAVVRLHPQAPAAATSITQTGVYAGGCIGPLGLGTLASTTSYPVMWSVAAVAMLTAAALMLLGSNLLRRHTI
ncbi:MFS transporter [Paractinoplanes atraurantiacus]|uniref:Cyanate permease n=1 Tax=Paractinoplanes atraurantiacus TaxID=1036182 RepID=A0A285K6G6_9ACTN|nr:MFS transporter [Actinoplanes atraurantiacus]SNY68184.1 Cyanate permease [Actinoplanes atraurantiacus]